MELRLHLPLTSDLAGGVCLFLRPENLPHLTSPRFPLNMTLGGQRSRSWSFGGELIVFTLPGMEPRFLGGPTCRLVIILSSLSWLPHTDDGLVACRGAAVAETLVAFLCGVKRDTESRMAKWYWFFFYIHGTVHRNSMSINVQHDSCILLDIYWHMILISTQNLCLYLINEMQRARVCVWSLTYILLTCILFTPQCVR